MKILITSDWYTPAVNGVVASILALRRQLEARGHEVRVLTLSGTVHTTCENGVYAVGSVDAGLIYPGARLRSFAVGQTVRRLVEWKPDVVHSQCEFSTFFLARHIARAVGAPLIHTYHTVYEDYTHYFSPSRRWGRLLARGFTRAILGSCDGVIAPTEKVRALLEGYGVKPPVTVIPTGIPLGRFAAPVSDAVLDRLRRRLGIPAENRILVYVGRLAKEKNLEELLECRAALGRAPVTLLLVGDGPARPALEERAAALGLAAPAAVFAGMAAPEEVPLYYRLGDVFVSASSSETQGLTYLEALAAGTPAVCRADPCLNGVIENGVNGWQYETGRERDEELNRLLTDEPLRKRLARGAAAGKGLSGMQLLSLAGFAACLMLGVWMWREGLFTSQERLNQFMGGMGHWAAAAFVLFQAVQVVVPVLPGGLGCLAGVVLFGPWQGFLYNYVGICAGSLAAFAIARSCGRPLLYRMFPASLIEKYDRWSEEKGRFARWFALLIFLPVAPDDYLCFLAGTTGISWQKYTAIILLCKPFSIALYSLGLTVAARQLLGLCA